MYKERKWNDDSPSPYEAAIVRGYALWMKML